MKDDDIVFHVLTDGTCKEEVKQTPPILTAYQGHTAAMSCEYTDSALTSLQWFKQIMEKGLFRLGVVRNNNENVTENRYVFTLNKDKKLSTMHITNLEVEDSATYWCGYEAQKQKAVDYCAKTFTF
ncbi:hypothetical protein GDO78_015621 [Eleutherodactylus coqui]|uniref:Ig-like domain-containing protein n=1 Tax=Eleutherodactylus coqui TaxID=57060 RepID=A0A8J6B282_ELECQ|nr:hypothetical protein GDO78_015621 [Eleutherodactylus coqui]